MNPLKWFWQGLTTPMLRDGEAIPDKFSLRAEQALALARNEADRRNANFVGTEHLLLGIIGVTDTAATALLKMDIDPATVRDVIEKSTGTGPYKTMPADRYTPRVETVLRLAAKEAGKLRQNYIGTEHILLGLLAEEDNVAARILRNLNVDLATTRTTLKRLYAALPSTNVKS